VEKGLGFGEEIGWPKSLEKSCKGCVTDAEFAKEQPHNELCREGFFGKAHETIRNLR
jgi:hypothetical protein